MIKKKLSQKTIKGLKDLGVALAYFFGSRVQGAFLERSDYDIGIVFFDEAKARDNPTALYVKVYDILSDELVKSPETRLDISLLQRANPALQMSAVKNGTVIFEGDPRFRADFEERVFKNYLDYQSLQREFESATFYAFS